MMTVITAPIKRPDTVALEHAWDIGDAGVVLLNMDGFLNPLRDQPRFKVLMEKWQDPAKR